jgi:hypothetical protein
MVDFASTQAWAKGEALSTNRESQTKAAAAKPLNASPPPTTNGMDRLYRQLAEIHAITAMQLAECACWRQSDPTPSLVQAGIGWQRPTMMPSVTRLAPSSPTNFSSQAPLWCWRIEP